MRDGTVTILGSVNLFGAALVDFCQNLEPAIHVLIGIAQLAVASVTVWYIVRRTRQLSKENKK
jgi:hypothetical protein